MRFLLISNLVKPGKFNLGIDRRELPLNCKLFVDCPEVHASGIEPNWFPSKFKAPSLFGTNFNSFVHFRAMFNFTGQELFLD